LDFDVAVEVVRRRRNSVAIAARSGLRHVVINVINLLATMRLTSGISGKCIPDVRERVPA